jgi:hypothetical protein
MCWDVHHEWCTRGHFRGKARPGRDADHSPHLVLRWRMSKIYTSYPLWRVLSTAGQLYFLHGNFIMIFLLHNLLLIHSIATAASKKHAAAILSYLRLDSKVRLVCPRIYRGGKCRRWNQLSKFKLQVVDIAWSLLWVPWGIVTAEFSVLVHPEHRSMQSKETMQGNYEALTCNVWRWDGLPVSFATKGICS